MESFHFSDHIDNLDAESKYLVHKAKEAAVHAYAPYSKFLVGAAILLENGKVITGTNQENASYPLGMCAERVALYAAVVQFPESAIVKVAITARRKQGKDLLPVTPCGGCRQVLVEFEVRQQKPIQIVMMDQHQWVLASSAQSLLPFSFTKVNLEHTHDPSNH